MALTSEQRKAHYRQNKAAYAERSKAYYRLNKEAMIAKAAVDQRIRKKRMRAWLRGLKEQAPCTDCGGRWPAYVMEYHHLGDKLFEIGKAVGFLNKGKTAIEAEIDKCVLLCANCHRMRTHGGGE